MSEPRYSRKAFWTVKVIMLLVFLLWYGDRCERYGIDRAMKENRALQYQANGVPYFWNGSIYPMVEFNSKKMTVKVKREILQ